MFDNSKNQKDLAEVCPTCNHPKITHMRNPRDVGRLTGVRPILGTCIECWKTNKECKYYMNRPFLESN